MQFPDFGTLISNLASAAGSVASSGELGGKKDQTHIAQAAAIMQLLAFVFNFHPSAPQPTMVQAADGAYVDPGTTVSK